MPVLAVGSGGGSFTAATIEQVMSAAVLSMRLARVGHYAALEAPEGLATAIPEFHGVIENR